MQPNSNGNVQLLQAMVLAGLEGLMTWLPELRAQAFVIQTFVPADGPANVLEPMLGDLERELAAAATAAETVFGYAEQAVWGAPATATATSTRGRKPPPPAAVKHLILRALVAYLQPHPKTTIRPARAVLCRLIREKGLRGGKGLHEKTFSRYLSGNHLSYDSVLDELWTEAQRQAMTRPPREASG
jgi:hypothetical protein